MPSCSRSADGQRSCTPFRTGCRFETMSVVPCSASPVGIDRNGRQPSRIQPSCSLPHVGGTGGVPSCYWQSVSQRQLRSGALAARKHRDRRAVQLLASVGHDWLGGQDIRPVSGPRCSDMCRLGGQAVRQLMHLSKALTGLSPSGHIVLTAQQ